MAVVAFPSPGFSQSDHGSIGLESPTSKGFCDAPRDRSDAESAVDEHFDSVASAPGLDDRQSQGIQDKAISENPFDSKDSKILFDAIDRLQSCGVSQELAIPQLIIAGGQSAGKSSLLQSLTDIPFPVGKSCCTRFATRIVSRRTAPGTVSTVRITIAEPEVPDRFGYPEDHSYRDYVYTTDRLGVDDFQRVMDEISTQYMGIRRGKGKGMKNFATQVLRIELSGPSRSHFSILDVPGLISNAHAVNEYEMKAVNKMIDDYIRQPANIVICVADAVTDLARQGIFMKTAVVEKKRLVGVFTKCDMLHDASEIVDIANGTGEYADKSMQDGWFVVRNRSPKDGDDSNLQEAESQLFDQPPWNNIDPSRRGAHMLKKHLGNLLCARIRDNFPTIRDMISRLLSEAEGSRQSLGDPRPTHNLRQQYLRDVLQRYGEIADKALYCPGFLDDEMMRVRAMTRSANEEFTQAMKDRGHAYNFQDADVDPVKQLTDIMSHHYSSQSQESPPTEQPVTPPSTPPKKGRERQIHNVQEQSATSFTQEVRSQLRVWQTTELPGLVNTEVIKVLFMKQSEKWEHIAEEHIDRVGRHVEDAADKILRAVCSPSDGCEIIQKELSAVIGQFQRQAKEKALSELKEYCRRERESHLQTTDIRFQQNLQALRSSRLLNTLGSMPTREGTLVEPAAHLHALFRHIHHSAEDNMINDVHDVVKVYYQISLCNFIEHVTSNITENFISHETGPLRGLSTKWMFTLTEEEVQKLAREDEHIVQQRTELEGIIEKLRTADDIVETARSQTSGLGDI
ncbi:vacuolar sorting protein VPS1 [Colletotrichum gloeosporioides Cg-14]|uniref:Vacuolar sorting protein VPS1 n=1 Tax=Colletotrichum gloeosporioides (strain Cg-14) TaxID=1237896 RepID=T0KN40_COLGC|nr:vacuolar sorting protein VPS1 [Colletotrichum gloeosporioides Cg-14]